MADPSKRLDALTLVRETFEMKYSYYRNVNEEKQLNISISTSSNSMDSSTSNVSCLKFCLSYVNN